MHTYAKALSGKASEAVAYLEEAARNAPRNAAVVVALADGLNRLNKPDLALAVIDRAMKPGAVGDQAALRITRVKSLTALNRGREARAGLIKDVEALPPAERPQVWVTLGQLESARGNDAEARRAYAEWARLLPEDPRPRLVLLELALKQTDKTAVRNRVDPERRFGNAYLEQVLGS